MRIHDTLHDKQQAMPTTHDVAADALALSSALLASVSHDLRNPLSVIHGAAEVLQERFAHLVDDDHHDHLHAIRRECVRMDEYVQGLLQATRLLVGGTARLVRDWIGIHDIVTTAVDRLLRYREHARVVVDIGAPLPPVRAHGPLVEQALLNVLDNAAKFSPPGGAVNVRVKQDDGTCFDGTHFDGTQFEGRNIYIEVVDEGPGIAPAQRERMFAYFVSDDPQSRGRAGSGLGLAISRSILRAHGGDVVAEPRSDAAKGTCIRMTLPTRADA
jgi:two-component system sensor histidine kinase KdpD